MEEPMPDKVAVLEAMVPDEAVMAESMMTESVMTESMVSAEVHPVTTEVMSAAPRAELVVLHSLGL